MCYIQIFEKNTKSVFENDLWLDLDLLWIEIITYSNFSAAEIIIIFFFFFFVRVENIVGKGENAGHHLIEAFEKKNQGHLNSDCVVNG